jgi:predicted aminopeptidase
MTHATLYLPSSVDVNENLANFVGDKGAQEFLAHQFGPHSKELQEYMTYMEDRRRFTPYMLASAERLDSLYHEVKDLSFDHKSERKRQAFQLIRQGILALPFQHDRFAQKLYASYESFNNADFLSFRRYNQQQDVFASLFAESKGDWKVFFRLVKDKFT